MIIYYAHCKSIYGTPQEKRDIELLERLGFEVINPNLPEHDKACEKCNDKMFYFTGLVKLADALAFRALPSGEIPSGVGKEIDAARSKDIPIIELPNFSLRNVMSVFRTKMYLKECGER
jgi:hypothetical protein